MSEKRALPLASPYPGDLLAHLRAFATLASIIDGGPSMHTFGRAASELALDQSVLRRRLQTLADFIGLPLLAGRGPTLRLTAGGLRLQAQAAQMIELATNIATPEEDDEGPLRVACTGTILAEVLPSVLGTMRQRHEKLRFRVRREGDESTRRLLANEEIDFGIVRSMVDLSLSSSSSSTETFHARRLAEDRLWLALPSSSPLAQRRRLTPADMARPALIGYPPASAGMKRIMSVIGPLGASPWIEVDRKAAALAYVAAGLGVAFVSLVANQTPPRQRNVVIRDVTSLFPRMAFWLVWSPNAMPLRGWRKDFVEQLRRSLHRDA